MLTWTDFPAQLTLRRNRAGQLAIQQHTVAATRVRVSRVSRDHKGRHKSVRLTSWMISCDAQHRQLHHLVSRLLRLIIVEG
jgi:hypothetical protein